MVYAGIMAHGTSLTAVECAHDSAIVCHQHSCRPRWARDERRPEPGLPGCWNSAATPDCRHLGRSDLASSDMMSMETTKMGVASPALILGATTFH